MESTINPENNSIEPQNQQLFPKIIKKYAKPSRNYHQGTLDVMTNLFQIGLDKIKAKNIFLYGIDVKEIFPNLDEKKNQILDRLKRFPKFKQEMKKHFSWYYINGLLLFGKPIGEPQKFSKYIEFHLNDQSNEINFLDSQKDSNSLESQYHGTEPSQIPLRYYTLTFTNRHCIMDKTKHEEEDSSSLAQIYRNFINIIMGKVLGKCGYRKDLTTRKILYYKDSDIKSSQEQNIEDPDEKNHYFFCNALKAVCDCYENDNVFFKISLKNLLLYRDKTYLDYYYYLMEEFGERLSEDQIKLKFKDDVIHQGRGIKMYSFRSEKIEDVIFENPYNLFFVNKEEKKISVGEYMNAILKTYNRTMLNEIQPIAVRYIDKGGKISRDNCQKLYVPMSELMIVGNIFGLNINQKSLIKQPYERYNELMKVRQEIINGRQEIKGENNEESLVDYVDFSLEEVKTKALVLQKPILQFGNNSTLEPAENGSFDLRSTTPVDKLKVGKFFIFLIGLNMNNGAELYNKLGEAAENLNIIIPPEQEVEVDIIDDLSNIKNILPEKLKNVNLEPKLDNFVFFFIHPKWKSLYKDIKIAVNKSDLKVPSQVIVYDQRKMNLSKFTNILAQMYGKIGKSIYKMDFDTYKETIIMAYSTLRTQNGLITSICMSVDNVKNSYMFLSKVENEANQSYSNTLNELVYESIKKIWKYRQIPVKNIIVYRDGANDKQLKAIRVYELEQFMNGLNRICEEIQKSSSEKYEKNKMNFKDIKVCFMVVNKSNDIRFFREDKENKNIINIPVGTVIDKDVRQDTGTSQDFHLNSAFAKQGTSTVTHYTIIYDDTELTANELYKLTYQLTFLNYNSTKSIKVPAPLYFVNRRNTFTKDCELGTIRSDLKLFNVSL